MNIQNTAIADKEIVVDDASTFNALGRDVVLNRCTLRCEVPAQRLSIRALLKETTVVAVKTLAGFSWRETRLERCTFKGKYFENEFGSIGNEPGFCQEVNFSEAEIDDCTFYGRVFDCRFPSWPYFVILNPVQNVADMRAVPAPEPLADDIEGLAFCDEATSAVSYNARSLASRTGLSVDEIKRYFAQFTFVTL